MHPKPTPQPIRTSDENEFAHTTMTTRLPKNIRNVIAAHPEYPPVVAEELERLAGSMETNEVMPSPALPSWDADRWREQFAERAGQRWQETDWFFAETYGFRLILEKVRFFQTGIDPYWPMKLREFESGSPFLPVRRFFGPQGPGSLIDNGSAGEVEKREILEEALHLSMWGNKADISFAAGGDLDHSAGDRELLLADHGEEASELLWRAAGPRGKAGGAQKTDPGDTTAPVHIVMDNSGAELAGDLVLALTLVRLTGAEVVLHPKFYPTYVSDTTVADIHIYLDRALKWGDESVTRFAKEVRNAMDRGSIVLVPDPFWCETRFLSEMPARLAEPFSEASMVIVKGDFNYRRALRDTIWTPNTTLEEAMGLTEAGAHGPPSASISGAAETPWLFLRTMKSDCLVGVDAEIADALDEGEPGWRTAGRRGVIQLLS